MTALVSSSTLGTFLRIPAATLDHGAADLMIKGALSLVRDELGQALDVTTGDVWTVRPHGGRSILLPELPVTAVTLVEERHDLDDQYSIPEAAWKTLTEDVDYEVDLREGIVWRRGHRDWPDARHPRHAGGLVRITNTHGFATLPDKLEMVVLRVAARGYLNPEAIVSGTSGKTITNYGASPGLYLSKADCEDLNPWRPGTRGGSK